MNTIAVVPMTLDISRAVSYEELETNLIRAVQAEGMAAKMAQANFSVILMQDRWREASLWVDTDTGEVYNNPYSAPDSIQNLVKTDTPRFQSPRDWMEYMTTFPGFARSTCYARHREIVKQMQVLGRTFDAALDSIMLSLSYSRLMLGMVTDEDSGTFLREPIMELLPAPMRDEAAAAISERGVTAMAEIVLDKMQADEARMLAGEDIRSVVGDLRTILVDAAAYRIVKHPRMSNAFVVSREEGDEEERYIIYIEDENHEAAPHNVMNWLAGRLHVNS